MDFKKIGDLIIELIEFSYFEVELFPRDPNYGSEAKVGPNFLLKIVGAKSSIVFDFLKLLTFTFLYYRKQPNKQGAGGNPRSYTSHQKVGR